VTGAFVAGRGSEVRMNAPIGLCELDLADARDRAALAQRRRVRTRVARPAGPPTRVGPTRSLRGSNGLRPRRASASTSWSR
jgi:hypothetical protein